MNSTLALLEEVLTISVASEYISAKSADLLLKPVVVFVAPC